MVNWELKVIETLSRIFRTPEYLINIIQRSWFPLGPENLKNGRTFPVGEKSGNFGKTGKVRRLLSKILEKSGEIISQ